MLKLKDLRVETPSGFRLSLDSLEIKKREILAVIGPNGAGKTTLLNVLALLTKAGAGSLEILGKNAFDDANRMFLRRAMSVIFSQPYLTGGTVRENISLPLMLRGVRDEGRVAEMLELFRIAAMKDRPAGQLSQGERHRVALARAFVTRPKLLLLDEPFSSLDTRVKTAITHDLRRVIKTAGASAILITQDRAEALALCDSMALMMNGRIVQRGTPTEIFARPVSKEAADFVGAGDVNGGPRTDAGEDLCSAISEVKTI